MHSIKIGSFHRSISYGTVLFNVTPVTEALVRLSPSRARGNDGEVARHTATS